MLFRDDDISKYTDLSLFLNIQSLFDASKILHTCAVVMEGLWDSRAIWDILLRHPNIKVDLHGWTHKPYSKLGYDEICEDIEKSLDYWYQHAKQGGGEITDNKKITTMYATWNEVSDDMFRACQKFGLRLDNNTNPNEVYGFHWWEMIWANKFEQLKYLLKK